MILNMSDLPIKCLMTDRRSENRPEKKNLLRTTSFDSRTAFRPSRYTPGSHYREMDMFDYVTSLQYNIMLIEHNKIT